MKIIKVDPLTIYFLFILVITGFLVNGIIIFIIVIIHELGHIIMIKHYGYQINSINRANLLNREWFERTYNSCIDCRKDCEFYF